MSTDQLHKPETKILPKLHFSSFNEGWESKKLSELLSESKELNYDLKFGKEEVLSVSGEYGIVNQVAHLGRSYAGESVHNYHVVETGDIVYTKSPLKANPYGIIKINKGKPGIVSTLYAVYKVNKSTTYGLFLDYYFLLDANTNRYLRPLVKKGAKNDMKINNAYVLHDNVFVPSPNEQQKIATFLVSVDKWIQNLRFQKESLEKYKKGMMQKLFTLQIRFMDKNGKDFPKWEFKTMEDLGDIYNGLSGKASEDFGEGEPFITYKQIFDNGEIDINKFALVRVAANERQNKAKFGDILITTSSETPEEVGFTSVLLDEVATPYLNSFSFGLRPKNREIFIPLFAKYFFRAEPYRQQVVLLAQGSTRYNISKNSFLKIRLPVPSFREQRRIADFLTSIEKLLESKQQQINYAEKWKKGLLQKMFI